MLLDKLKLVLVEVTANKLVLIIVLIIATL